MFPDVPGEPDADLSSGAFLTCSADNTIRMWRIDDWTQTRVQPQNILSSVSLASMWCERKENWRSFFLWWIIYSIYSCFAGSVECNLHRWKHQHLAGSRLYNKCQCRQIRRRTDSWNQDRHQDHLCQSRRQTPGIWRPQRHAEVQQDK